MRESYILPQAMEGQAKAMREEAPEVAKVMVAVEPESAQARTPQMLMDVLLATKVNT